MTAIRILIAMALVTAAQHALAWSEDDAERLERANWKTLSGRAPLVIGHRGSSGARPEHTLESYELAIEQGADFIEPDLVSTKDGHLIARHEPFLDGTTDVASRPEFANRKSTKLLDGVPVTGFFASDFTLAEIKQLRAIQPRADRPQEFNGRFQIPTFEEVVQLARRGGHERGRPVGIYPETKHPTFHFALGLPLEERLLDVLRKYRLNDEDAPVFIQSFETANLRFLRTQTNVKLVQLIGANDVKLDGSLGYAPPYGKPYDFAVVGDPRGFGDLIEPQSLADIAKYASGIGLWKRHIVSVRGADANGDGKADDVNGDGSVNDADKRTTAPTNLIDLAHKAGLLVHAYTFRNEKGTLGADYAGDPKNEYVQFYLMGVDGVFSDYPDTALAARKQARRMLP